MCAKCVKKINIQCCIYIDLVFIIGINYKIAYPFLHIYMYHLDKFCTDFDNFHTDVVI